VNDCVNVEAREALPDLLNGRLSELDTATMKAHVESCAECRSELALLREARATSLLAPALDLGRIAAAIPPYGGSAVSPEPARQPAVAARMWTLAAAAVLVVAGGWLASLQRDNKTDDVPRVATASSPVPQSQPAIPDSPSATAVRGAPAVEASSNDEVQLASLSLLGSTTDISDSDLEQLVADLDAIEAIPNDEPTPVTITVDDVDATNDQ
jgi:anti-sigma factor RsiW